MVAIGLGVEKLGSNINNHNIEWGVERACIDYGFCAWGP